MNRLMFVISAAVLLLIAGALFSLYQAAQGLREHLHTEHVQQQVNTVRLKALLKLGKLAHVSGKQGSDPESILGAVLTREILAAHRAAQNAGRLEAWEEFLPKEVAQVREACRMIEEFRSQLTKGDQEAAERLKELIDELLR